MAMSASVVSDNEDDDKDNITPPDPPTKKTTFWSRLMTFFSFRPTLTSTQSPMAQTTDLT